MVRADELERKLKNAAGRVAVLKSDLGESEKRGEKETARGRQLAEDLTAARMRLKDLQATAKLVPALRVDLKEAHEQYATEKALATALEKEIAKRLSDLKEADSNLESMQASRRSLQRDLESRDKELALARRRLTTLRQQNKTLEGETARVRAAAENRFAGITLTGRRVVFLVDMSGSMELVDEKTKAPTKWADVRNTVARLMRSLPDLEKYQVIVFAEGAAFLFDGEEGWLDFDARSSVDRVRNGLATITPKGGTNMYAALQTAFHLRAQGLDTIYLLSDGLPNLGEGVRRGYPEHPQGTGAQRPARPPHPQDSSNRLEPHPARPTARAHQHSRLLLRKPRRGRLPVGAARENDGSFVGMSKP